MQAYYATAAVCSAAAGEEKDEERGEGPDRNKSFLGRKSLWDLGGQTDWERDRQRWKRKQVLHRTLVSTCEL